MVTPVHPPSGLLKATWTSRDHPAMVWRGCTIHAINIGRYEDNRVQIHDDGTVDTDYDDLDDTVPWDILLLDIDYLVRPPEAESPGAEPDPPGAEPDHYWVAPATLAFTWASGIVATIGDGAPDPSPLDLGITETTLEIAELHLIAPEGNQDPAWHITGQGFDIRLNDAGYCLYLRTAPRRSTRPFLDLTERGGISFAQKSFG